MTAITLDTQLTDIGFDDAILIPCTLIDESVVGVGWGVAWDQVLRAAAVGDCDGTVRDLRALLYGDAWEQGMIEVAGWTGDHEGYDVGDYFRDGRYLGPDMHGVEPAFRPAVPPCIVRT